MAHRPTILVIDDSEVNRGILRNLLRHDYTLLFAENGATGLEAARQGLPDLVLLDVVMPDLDGFTVCRRLKAEAATADTPVIFITGEADPLSTKQGFEAGAVDYIVKPFYPAEALARIRNHLALRDARRRLTEQNDLLRETIREQEISIDLARKILAHINAAPPRYTELPGGLLLFASCCILPCKAEGGDHLFLRSVSSGNSGRTLFSLKDQSGHAVNCVLRSIATDLTHHGLLAATPLLPLRETMTRLNDTLIDAGLFGGDDFFTAISGEIDHQTLALRYISAGHPPLLLIRQGKTTALPGSDGEGANPPLGAIPGLSLAAGHYQLKPGDMLIAYSDGLTEMPRRQRDSVFNSDDLRAMLRQIMQASPEIHAEDLLGQLLATVAAASGETVALPRVNSSADDVTILALEIEDSRACHSQTLVPSSFENLDAMLHCFYTPIQGELAGRGYHDLEFKIHAALCEALVNAFRHGNRENPAKPVEVRWRFGNDLTVEIIDQGDGFCPAGLPDPTDPRHLLGDSGRGIFIIRKFADSVEWLGRGNHLRLRFAAKTVPGTAEKTVPFRRKPEA
ncbi:MAG: SpoIIE family protein phosphatase [Thermodesulfobacteriota bacterium]